MFIEYTGASKTRHMKVKQGFQFTGVTLSESAGI